MSAFNQSRSPADTAAARHCQLRDSARQAQREARLEKVWAKERAWVGRMRECPTFYPSEEEFADPMAYIAKIRGEGMKYGICKVRHAARPRGAVYDLSPQTVAD